uniref:Elongation factor P n=1 Tax=candidate division WWE3 bacterium TaxID=2053526 RepID=A0A7C4TPD6_UNCKA
MGVNPVRVRVPPCPPKFMLASELKTGRIFKDQDTPFQVVKYEHVKTARGGATVRVKAKNLLNGSVLEKSFGSTERVEDADVTRGNLQYIYKDNSGYIFMNPNTYEQTTIGEDIVGSSARFLKEGESVQVVYFEDNPISMELPKTIIFEIQYTEPGYKGNTVTNTYKDATLTNGTVIKVPTFVKIGDIVKVNTETGEYVSKA